MKWEKVKEVACKDAEGTYRVRAEDGKLVIEKMVGDWEDVTKSCRLEFRDSHHCDGRYIAVIFRSHITGDRTAVVIGIKGVVAQKGFKVEPAPMAYTSFKIFRKT